MAPPTRLLLYSLSLAMAAAWTTGCGTATPAPDEVLKAAPTKDPNATTAAEALRVVLRWTIAYGDWPVWPFARSPGTQRVGSKESRYDARGRLLQFDRWSLRWRGALPLDAVYRSAAPVSGELVQLGFAHDHTGRLVHVDGMMAPEETKGIDQRVRVLYDRFGRVVELRVADADHTRCRNHVRIYIRYGPADRIQREVRILKSCDGLGSGAVVYDYVYDSTGTPLRREIHRHRYGADWDDAGFPPPESFKRPRGDTWRADVFDRGAGGALVKIRQCTREITQSEMRCKRSRTVTR